MDNEHLSMDIPIRSKVEIDMRQDRLWAVACHVSALSCFLGIPLGNILGPWIIWLIKRNEIPLVDREGRKALNFQLSMTLYFLIAAVLCFIFMGFLFIIPLFLMELVITIMAGVKTNQDKEFQYPLSIKFMAVS